MSCLNKKINITSDCNDFQISIEDKRKHLKAESWVNNVVSKLGYSRDDAYFLFYKIKPYG